MAGDQKQPAAAGTPRGDVRIDPRRQQLIGVRTVPVKREAVEETIRAVGQVRYDETRLADINLKLEGWIRELYVDYTGQLVRKGQPLFTLYSPDLLTTENEYLLALKTRDQMQQSVIPDARQRADDLVTSSRQRLTLWDLPEETIRQLEETRRVGNLGVLSACTHQKSLSFAKGFFTWTVERGYLKETPFCRGQGERQGERRQR